jgi:membrane associated rhomboid family serine protease
VSSFFIDKNTGKFSAISFIITITIAIQTVVFLIPEVGRHLIVYCGLIPGAVIPHGQVWRLISYALLHDSGGFFHIAFNMLGLWMFGKEIEYMWGNKKFFQFYIFTALFAGAFSLLSILLGSPGIIIIGASGAIMALLVVYAYYFPQRQLLFFFVIPMKVKTAVIIYAIISVWGTRSGAGSIAHITHLGGILAGFLWIRIGDQIDFMLRNISAFFQNSSLSQKTEYKFERKTPKRNLDINMEEIDRILDKINNNGIHSLTAQERKILQNASADYQKNK